MTSMFEEGESRTEISVRCQHAVNGREGHQKYNVLCTDQWGIHDRFETKKIVISHVLGYEQSVWKDKVIKVACVWMQIETKKFRFDEVFLRNYNEDRDKGYILEVDVKYSKNLCKLLSVYCFYLKEWRWKNVINSFVICATRKAMLYT